METISGSIYLRFQYDPPPERMAEIPALHEPYRRNLSGRNTRSDLCLVATRCAAHPSIPARTKR